jgi:hypothetical protein
MCEDFTPNFGNKRTGCCFMTTHLLTLPFSPRNFWHKITWLSSPTHPTFLCFARLKIQLKGYHLDTVEIIRAELQVLGTVHMHRRELLWRWWWPVGTKLIFDQVAALVPAVMDGSLYLVLFLSNKFLGADPIVRSVFIEYYVLIHIICALCL